ncbi:hypothetical protein CJ195_21890 [Bacillus sp. UMB0899]|uniref:hypothetical protein n=1 Tax=Metabacillus sp. YM-086 TaxID=3341729 RepID=UPI000C7FB40A|nr:hypothetical protein CJ195_21890 [Bacillus sp. UMB0899]
MYKEVSTEVKEIIKKYEYDRSIKKYNFKHFFNTGDNIFRKITTKRDVEIAQNHVVSRINEYKNAKYRLVEEDILDLERSIGEYEIAVKKVLQCYSHANFDFDYTAEELQELIDNIFKYHEKLTEVSMRKAFQD